LEEEEKEMAIVTTISDASGAGPVRASVRRQRVLANLPDGRAAPGNEDLWIAQAAFMHGEYSPSAPLCTIT
jgi:hypothetical protein